MELQLINLKSCYRKSFLRKDIFDTILLKQSFVDNFAFEPLL